jgi:sortase A
VRFIQRASIVFVAAGVLGVVAASAAASGGSPTPGSGDAATLGTASLPPTDSIISTVQTVGASTLPSLPIPATVPPDNELEPQTYHGRLQIPAIDIDAPLIEGIRLSTLDFGPGHWPGTAMPGELGNVVVAGHRTSHDAHFRNVDQLQPGDQVIFDLDDSQGAANGAAVPNPDLYTGRFVYEVAFVEVVGPEAMWIVSQDYRHMATLFACHPPGSVSQRIVVHLDLVDETGEMVDPPRPSTTTSTVATNG